MITWYAFESADTLFFKGSTPMYAGLDHTAASIFPPRASTIQGALRTLVLMQNKVNIDDYHNGRESVSGIRNAIGKAGEDAPFQVIGPVFMLKGRPVVPAPYTWYIEDIDDKDEAEHKDLQIYRSCPIDEMELGNIRIHTSVKDKQRWAFSKDTGLSPMRGCWISGDLIGSSLERPVKLYKKKEPSLPDEPFIIKDVNALYAGEPHTGIALEQDVRTARKGHLYSFTHYRLQPGVRIIFGIDKPLPIEKTGVLQLGGEKRFGSYSQLDSLDMTEGASGLYMSLSPVEAGGDATRDIVATGKAVYAGGWDMKRRFHKDMLGYYPAGSVFSSRIRPDFIQI
ncbi:MAG: hypothetical protein JXM72_11915 [Deltaproteobacteria bacterium]|nr:hypothetical protein [Deltaproteobacteria bacterium]